MKLTQDQIAEIRRFIHSRGFKHIEVEMEIMDHVASAIEDKLAVNPNLSMEKALHEVHSSFGVFGFATIEEEKQKYFQGLIIKQFWKEVKQYFLGNKIWITVFVMTTLSSIFILLSPSDSFLRLFPFALSTTLVITVYSINYYKFKKWKAKSLMLYASTFPLIVLQPNIGNFIGFLSEEINASNYIWMTMIYMALNLLMIIFILSAKSTCDWGFNWTNERYLKYVD
ncbi:MAG: hypothetical protein ACJAVN_002738 [Roseivirga sp.]